MNNQSSYLPRLLDKPKDMAGTERLASKISGCIITSGWYESKRKCLFYINHDQVRSILYASYNDLYFLQFENASDLIVTLIYRLLEDFVSDHLKLPRKLHLNLGSHPFPMN